MYVYIYCWLKKYSQLKSWELCFIRWEFLGLQAQETTSQVTLKNRSEEVRGGTGLYRSFATKGRWSEHQKIIVS